MVSSQSRLSCHKKHYIDLSPRQCVLTFASSSKAFTDGFECHTLYLPNYLTPEKRQIGECGVISAQTPSIVITGSTPLQHFYAPLPIASYLILSSYHQPGPVSPRLQTNVISLKKTLNLATLPPKSTCQLMQHPRT